jgi:hypothetical protein
MLRCVEHEIDEPQSLVVYGRDIKSQELRLLVVFCILRPRVGSPTSTILSSYLE